nr:hypothetical protein CFP56_00510 [Quercus suber]
MRCGSSSSMSVAPSSDGDWWRLAADERRQDLRIITATRRPGATLDVQRSRVKNVSRRAFGSGNCRSASPSRQRYSTSRRTLNPRAGRNHDRHRPRFGIFALGSTNDASST